MSAAYTTHAAPGPAFLWPVYAYRDGMRRTVATFFSYGDAVTFVNRADCNLYIAEPKYDRRELAIRTALRRAA